MSPCMADKTLQDIDLDDLKDINDIPHSPGGGFEEVTDEEKN